MSIYSSRNVLASGVWVGLLGVTLFGVIASGCSSVSERPAAGSWSAWLDGPGGEVPFILEVAHEEGQIRAWIVTGSGRMEIPQVHREGGHLSLAMAEDGPSIQAEMGPEGKNLCGKWIAPDGSSLVFAAEVGLPCLPGGRAQGSGETPAPGLEGDYKLSLSEAVGGRFSVDRNGHTEGQLQIGTGELIELRGGVIARRLQLAGFDGRRACVLRAQADDAGTFHGYFWLSDQGLGAWQTAKE